MHFVCFFMQGLLSISSRVNAACVAFLKVPTIRILTSFLLYQVTKSHGNKYICKQICHEWSDQMYCTWIHCITMSFGMHTVSAIVYIWDNIYTEKVQKLLHKLPVATVEDENVHNSSETLKRATKLLYLCSILLDEFLVMHLAYLIQLMIQQLFGWSSEIYICRLCWVECWSQTVNKWDFSWWYTLALWCNLTTVRYFLPIHVSHWENNKNSLDLF